MKLFDQVRVSRVLRWTLTVMLVLAIPSVLMAQWHANVGAENKNESRQADAFLPNEIWISAGDSITWTFVPKNEPHTVTLLAQNTMPEQARPLPPPPVGPPAPVPTGCPGVQPSGSSYTGANCITSGISAGGATYTIKFPNAGNYKLICLIHTNMNGTVHVLPTTDTLPHHQGFYDDEARDQASDLINDSDNPREERSDFPHSQNEVLMTGEMAATGGGRQYLAIVRFFPGTIEIHAGDTVEWTNTDPSEPHTVTFGTEPGNPMSLVNVSPQDDGALHGTISSGTDSVSSGFLQAAPEDAVGRPQSPVGSTRIRITFAHAGTYNYICALHDVNGMVGKVVVLP
jgi:plastocyanin